jgi:hypothetical protein
MTLLPRLQTFLDFTVMSVTVAYVTVAYVTVVYVTVVDCCVCDCCVRDCRVYIVIRHIIPIHQHDASASDNIYVFLGKRCYILQNMVMGERRSLTRWFNDDYPGSVICHLVPSSMMTTPSCLNATLYYHLKMTTPSRLYATLYHHLKY